MAAAAISSPTTSTTPELYPSTGPVLGQLHSHEYLYSHQRGSSNSHSIPRLPKTQPPTSPPPDIPTYDYYPYQAEILPVTPSPFKKKDLISRTPISRYTTTNTRDWAPTVLSPNEDGTSYRHVDPYKHPEAMTPEHSSEEDREMEETPIYMRSERFRQSFQGRITPHSQEEYYDEEYAGSILGDYADEKHYSYETQQGEFPPHSPSPTSPSNKQETNNPNNRNSWNRRDITPSRIPIFYASPKPIPMEYIFRSAPLQRSPSTHLADHIDPPIKRIRSESLLDTTTPPTTPRNPTKRKYSTLPRPRSRSMSSMRSRTKVTPSPGKRPPSAKGEPPWIQHTFSPDPNLPPEEQLIPTVAKRLNQERLEREKGLVTVWDREMRPLDGDKRVSRVRTHKEADDMPARNITVDKPLEEEVWPLNENEKSRNNRSSVFPPAAPQPILPGGPLRVDARAITSTLGPMQRFEPDQHDDVKAKCCCIIM